MGDVEGFGSGRPEAVHFRRKQLADGRWGMQGFRGFTPGECFIGYSYNW